MQVWELFYAGFNDYSVLAPLPTDYNILDILMPNGKPKHWATRPKVEPFIDKRKKKARPRADLSYLIAGSIVLNEKAYTALKDFLLPFGQLLELDCKGEVEYYYNVTNILPCIDYERSLKQDDAVVQAIFLPDVIPAEPMIFKDAYTAESRIYFNQAARDKFEQIASAADLFGACFVDASKDLFQQIRERKAQAGKQG